MAIAGTTTTTGMTTTATGMAVATAAFVPTLLRALTSIFGPIISDLHARDEMQLLARLFKTTTEWCFALSFPLVLVMAVFAPTLMPL